MTCPGIYVLAVPRELRGVFPADWQVRVRALGAAAPEPSASPHRLEIEADNAVLDRIRAEFGGRLRIEARSVRTKDG